MTAAAPEWVNDLLDSLDREGSVPIYQQIAGTLEAAILAGRIQVGDTLENEVSIARFLGISRPTVRRALQELVDKGLLVRRRGAGTQVVRSTPSAGASLGGLFSDLADAGRNPSTAVLEFEHIAPSDAVAAALRLGDDDHVVHLRRLRLADGAPVALLENWLPASIKHLSVEGLTGRGLSEALESWGTELRVASLGISARAAHQEEARLLEVPRRAAVLTTRRIAYDHAGVPVNVGQHVYRPDRFTFETTLVAK